MKEIIEDIKNFATTPFKKSIVAVATFFVVVLLIHFFLKFLSAIFIPIVITAGLGFLIWYVYTTVIKKKQI